MELHHLARYSRTDSAVWAESLCVEARRSPFCAISIWTRIASLSDGSGPKDNIFDSPWHQLVQIFYELSDKNGTK
jgi:hypothetical protein